MGTLKKSPMSNRSDPDCGTASTSSSSAGVGSTTSATKRTPTTTSTSSSTTQPTTSKANAVASASHQSTAGATPAAAGSTSSSSPSARRLSESMSAGSGTAKRRGSDLSHLYLIVCQQPERARLCSYKEENDTVDRRPVDPPPVVELASHLGTFPDLLDSTQFFIRASLVSAEPSASSGPDTPPGDRYTAIKTPTGADPTSGEVIQTPERLKHLDGTPGALCIFPKLSVRLPGVFRLKFTLFETGQEGMSEITHVVSAQFEVFSPKLFKGMHESTRLTRHLANQGLKVKLRTDPNGGKGSNRRRVSAVSYNGPPGRGTLPESPSRTAAHGSVHHPSQAHYTPLGGGPASAAGYGHHSRNLVWHPRYHHQGYLSETERSAAADEPRKRPRTSEWRDNRDDGLFERNHISSKLDLVAPSPSSDLSAFSLGHSGNAPSPPGYTRWGPRDAGEDDGFPAFPISRLSSSAPPPRRQFSDPRSTPQEPYAHDRARGYGRDTEPLENSPRVSPIERQVAGRERELARERDLARERAMRDRDRDLPWESEVAWDRDARDRRGRPHAHYTHPPPPPPAHPSYYSPSRSYSPHHSQPPPSHGPHVVPPPDFALPRLPPIVTGGDPSDLRAAPHLPPATHPYPPPPSHHRLSRSAHASPQTPQGQTYHPQHPLPPAHGRPHSAGPPNSASHGSSNHYPGPHSPPSVLLPPIRERSPAHTHMPRPYDRDPRT